MLVSIIVPIYNCEAYLDKCIDSLVSQTHTELEILLIDDGSTDLSAQKCDDWARRDKRIRVFHKTNEGQGIARNLGIENARGEFVFFVDSDDNVSHTAIEQAARLATTDNSDIVVFGFNTVSGNDRVLSSFVPNTPKSSYSGDEIRDFFLPELIAPTNDDPTRRLLYMSIWCCLFSRELIERANWRFVSERDIISEDVFSLLKLYKYVSKVSVLPVALYNYRNNELSFSRSYRSDRYDKVKHFYTESVMLCRQLGYSDDVTTRLSSPYLAYTIVCLKQECTSYDSFLDNLNAIKRIIEEETLQTVLNGIDAKNVGIQRRLLYFAIRHKMYCLCYLILNGKRMLDSKE